MNKGGTWTVRLAWRAKRVQSTNENVKTTNRMI